MSDFAFPPLNFNPWETVQGAKNMSGFYNQLIEYNPETDDPIDIRGDLAKSWELAKDGVTYTFRLHENARWWDGTPVTAADVVFSLDKIAEPGALRPQIGVFNFYYAPGNSRVIDEHTVEVKTKNPSAEFISVLATDFFKILAKHWVESGVDTKKWENAMGSGPFKPGKLIKDSSFELSKNPDYWKKGLPYLDGMKHFTIVDKGSVIAAYKTEQVLMSTWAVSNLSNQEALQLGEDAKDKLKVYFIPYGSMFGTVLNTSVKPFNDARVRRALQLSFHRPEFRQVFVGEIGSIGSPLPPGSWFGRTEEEIARLPGFRVTADGKKHPDDLAEARRLLAEAGYPNGFEVEIMARTVVEFIDLAQLEAAQMRKYLNIEGTISTTDNATGLARYAKGDFKMSAQGKAFLVPEPDQIFLAQWLPEGLFGGWSRWKTPPKFVELYQKQSAELDRTKRKAILREMEDFLLNEDPGGFIVLYWNNREWIVNHKVKNFHIPPALFAQLKHEHLWCDPKC